MKKCLFRFVTLALASLMFLSMLVSCNDGESQGVKSDNEDENLNAIQNFIGKEAFTFMTSEPTDRGTEKFVELFEKSEFYTDLIEYGECRNLMSEEISDMYEIEIFSQIERNNETYYYVLYNGRIFRINTLGGIEDSDHGIVQLALADYNNDGYFELLCSYNASRGPDETGRWGYCHSHIFVLDSRTYVGVDTYTYYDGLIYFKKDEDGLFDAYSSKDRNPENANELCYELKKNSTRYRFANESVLLKSDNYEAVVTVREGTVHFPIILDSMALTFNVEVEMTYLGDTFSYTNGTGYLAGAVPKFVRGDDTVPMMGWGEITVVTKFIVMTGQVITREYEFINSSTEPSKEGAYDLIVEYRGEKVLLEDFLTISRE